MMQTRQIAVILDLNLGYGRGLAHGVMAYARSHPDCRARVFSYPIMEGGTLKLGDWRADAVIAHLAPESDLTPFQSYSGRVVNVSGLSFELGFSQVMSDDVAVGRLVAEHFLNRGFRHFAFAGYHSHGYSIRRHQGFRETVASAGLGGPHAPVGPKPVMWVEATPRPEETVPLLQSLPRPTALMAANDLRARNVFVACEHVGLKIPDDIAVIGVDDDDAVCEILDPPLSSVALNTEQIGFEAARLAMQLAAGEPPPPKPILIPPKGIVSRRSSDTLGVSDPLIRGALEFILQTHGTRLHVDQLARHVHLSRRALELRFRRILGRSPAQEIRRVRLERVKDLLCHSEVPMPLLAERTGYANAEHLANSFRAHTGMTPTAYRRQFQLRG